MVTLALVFIFVVVSVPLGLAAQRWLFKQADGSTITNGSSTSSAMIRAASRQPRGLASGAHRSADRPVSARQERGARPC